LMRAGEAMPRWMRLRRKGAYLRNPSLGLLVFLLVSMGSSMLINSWRAALSGLEGEVVLFIVGLLSVLGAVAILLFVRRWERDEEAHIASEWDERRARMQALIEGEGPMED
ncbi:MAG: hypothetical protein MUE65_00905, partial [Methanomassiliicoccales archaeon]|nr:hypothetical protein [Methanomassiliicoccales archaeon]